MSEEPPADALALLDWRRRIAELYAEVRASTGGQAPWRRWYEVRSHLFREHPQSPIPGPGRGAYSGPYVYDHDPAWRALASLRPAEPRRLELPATGEEVFAGRRFGLADFELAGARLSLELYWLEGYGGGLFVPFADATSGEETYGAGRYLLDTVKGADLGQLLVLDFNFAYQPSCSYDPRWGCPLAPPANRLGLPVRADERLVPSRGRCGVGLTDWRP